MSDSRHTSRFWLGNALLAISLLLLFFMGQLWALLGTWAMGVWMVIAGVGMYLVTSDRGPSSTLPD